MSSDARADGGRRKIRWWWVIYGATMLLFVLAFSRFYLPGKGFTYVINFGSRLENRSLSKLHKLDYFVLRHSDGYDAQYYAQIALDPSLQNTQLPAAVDNLPYRARRILFSATAYVLGLGQPDWILQAYALQNGLAWLVLAVVLLWWFPATNWQNFVRWFGVLFSLGMCISVRNALLDGPSLLLLAGGVLLAEKGRGWMSALILAISGLGKETNLLGAACLAPPRIGDARAWGSSVLRGLLVAAPLVAWLLYLYGRFGDYTVAGSRNLSLPLVAYAQEWRVAWPALVNHELYPLVSFAFPLANVLLLVALTIQFLFLVLRPQWREAWWRVGITFAILMVFLGEAVWEGAPSAAARVLLPLQLAFNVLVPRGRWWVPVLLLGNLTVVAGPAILEPLVSEGFEFRGATSLRENAAGKSVVVEFDDNWYDVERDGFNYWLWASGDSTLRLRNPHARPLEAQLKFSLTPNGARTVMVRLNGVEVWRTTLAATDSISANLRDLAFQPGDNTIEFATNEPATRVGSDPRPLAFNLSNLRIELLGVKGAPPP